LNSSDRRELRNKRREEKLCTECGKAAELGLMKCLHCHTLHLARNKKSYNKAIAAGKCACGRESGDAFRCVRCAELHKLTSRDLRKRRVTEGKCIRCGKPLMERTDVTKCNNCMEETFGFRW